MKKNLTTVKNILMGVLAATAMTMASCSDDYEDFNAPKNEVSQAFSANDPLGIGYNSVAVNMNEIESAMIPVNTNRINITNSNPNIEYKVVNKDGKTFILPVYRGNGGETDIIRISHMDSDAKKAVFVTINPSSNGLVTRATTGDSMEERVLNTLANGLIPGKAAPEVEAELPIFNVQDLQTYDKMASDMHSSFIKIQKSPYSDYFYRHAKNHNEHVQQEANSVGFDLAIPLGGWNFGFGMDYNKNTSSHTIQERESATYGWVERAATGSISQEFLLNMLDKEYADKGTNALNDYVDQTAKAIMAVDNNYQADELDGDVRMALAYQKVMNQGLNNALNNPNSSAYKLYTEANLRNLITKYGMYVSTSCQMGGIAQTTYSRNANSSETSIEWVLKMKASGSQNKTVKETEKTEVKIDSLHKAVSKIVESNPTAAKFTLNIDKSSKVQDILQTMDEQTETKCWGGSGAKETKDWTFDANNPSQWVCISYSSPCNENTGFRGNSSLIPLWKLCIDPARRAALRKLIEPDANQLINYFEYKKAGAKHLVIADVQLKVYTRGENNNNILPYYAKDNRPTGCKTHLYIPLVNRVGRFSATGEPVKFGRGSILLEKGDDERVYIENTMVPFVAYEWVYDEDVANGLDYTGITSIDFGSGKANAVKCSERTYKMMKPCAGYCPRKDIFLLLTYAQNTTPIKDRIKAVGFQFTDKDYKNTVFASSLGTDAGGNYNTKDAYNEHWCQKDFINHNVETGKNIYEGLVRRWSLMGGSEPYSSEKPVYPCASVKEVTANVNLLIQDALQRKQ